MKKGAAAAVETVIPAVVDSDVMVLHTVWWLHFLFGLPSPPLADRPAVSPGAVQVSSQGLSPQ